MPVKFDDIFRTTAERFITTIFIITIIQLEINEQTSSVKGLK